MDNLLFDFNSSFYWRFHQLLRVIYRTKEYRSQLNTLSEHLKFAKFRTFFFMTMSLLITFLMNLIAVALKLLLHSIWLLGVLKLRKEFKKLNLIHYLSIRQRVFDVFNYVKRVVWGIENCNLGEFFEENNHFLLLYQLSVIHKLVLESMHVTEISHWLLKSSWSF